MAGVEIIRRIHDQYHGKPPVTIRLVDRADEEGARFGKSLFGSSAFSGQLDTHEACTLVDRDGITLPAALADYQIDFSSVKQAAAETQNAAASLAAMLAHAKSASEGFAQQGNVTVAWQRIWKFKPIIHLPQSVPHDL